MYENGFLKYVRFSVRFVFWVGYFG